MKRLGWLAIAVTILFGAAYFGSPFLAWRMIRESARNADERRMARVIDLPAVRDGLKAQLRALFVARIAADPRLKENPYPSLSRKLLPDLVERMIDAYLTPEAIALMVSEVRPPLKPGERVLLGAGAGVAAQYAFLGLNQMRITATAQGEAGAPLEFLLQRHGLFTWRLEHISLPPKAFTRAAADRGAARWSA